MILCYIKDCPISSSWRKGGTQVQVSGFERHSEGI